MLHTYPNAFKQDDSETASPIPAQGPHPVFYVVGVCGDIGHGKDTTADHLVRDFGFRRVAFADALKRSCAEATGIPLGHFYDREEKEVAASGYGYRKSPRQIAQVMGSEGFRNLVDPDIWVKRLGIEIEQIRAEGYIGAVVPDVRFGNEARWVDSWNDVEGCCGVTWRALRPGYPRSWAQPKSAWRSACDRLTGKGGKGHQSEDGISANHIDATLFNVGLDEYRATVFAATRGMMDSVQTFLDSQTGAPILRPQ